VEQWKLDNPEYYKSTITKKELIAMDEQRAEVTKSPLIGLLEWEQKALTGLDADISDLIQKLGPLLEQPTTEKEPREQKDTHGSEFAKQYQTNIQKIERLSDTVKDLIRRCDV
jgi:hypothetical protein